MQKQLKGKVQGCVRVCMCLYACMLRHPNSAEPSVLGSCEPWVKRVWLLRTLVVELGGLPRLVTGGLASSGSLLLSLPLEAEEEDEDAKDQAALSLLLSSSCEFQGGDCSRDATWTRKVLTREVLFGIRFCFLLRRNFSSSEPANSSLSIETSVHKIWL